MLECFLPIHPTRPWWRLFAPRTPRDRLGLLTPRGGPAWLDDAGHGEIVNLGFEGFVGACESDTGLLLLLQRRGAMPEVLDLHRVEDAEQVEAAATMLVEVFGSAESLGAVRSLLSPGDLDADSLFGGLEDLLVLPVAEPRRRPRARRGPWGRATPGERSAGARGRARPARCSLV